MSSMKFILTVTLLVLGLAPPAWLRAEEPVPILKGIRVFRSGESLGVEISADRNFEYSCSKMPQLLRVVVDLPRTETGRPDTVYKYKSAIVSDIRVEKKNINNVKMTRVSINLTEDAEFTSRTGSSDANKMTMFFRKGAPRGATGSGSATAAALPVGAAAPAALARANPAPPAPARGAQTNAAAAKVAAPPVPAVPVAVQGNPAKAPLVPVVPGKNRSSTVTAVTGGADALEIRSAGSIGEFKAFTLEEPGRLVLDIPGAQSTLRSVAIAANRFGVSKARLSPFEGNLRLVFDAGTKQFPGYQVQKTATGLRVLLRTANGK